MTQISPKINSKKSVKEVTELKQIKQTPTTSNQNTLSVFLHTSHSSTCSNTSSHAFSTRSKSKEYKNTHKIIPTKMSPLNLLFTNSHPLDNKSTNNSPKSP
jgi:hypothetical protein